MAGGDLNLKALLVTIAEAAPLLRAKGIVGRVEVHGVISFEVAPPEPPPADDIDDEPSDPDPLEDPDTYGRGYVPRRRRPVEGDEP